MMTDFVCHLQEVNINLKLILSQINDYDGIKKLLQQVWSLFLHRSLLF